MTNEESALLKEFEFSAPASAEDETAFEQYRQWLPPDYLEFLQTHNGGMGYVGPDKNYFHLFDMKSIADRNPFYPDEEFATEVVIIGTDGGGTLYGFHKEEKVFFETDEFEMTNEEKKVIGTTFSALLSYMAERNFD